MEKQEKMYEMAILLLPTISQSNASDEVSSIKNIIEKNGASVVSEGNLSEIDLAYEMIKKINSKNEKFNSAYFTWIKFTSEVSNLSLIKEEVDDKEEILRYMVIKTESDDELTDVFSGFSEKAEEVMTEESPEKDSEEDLAEESSDNSNEDESISEKK